MPLRTSLSLWALAALALASIAGCGSSSGKAAKPQAPARPCSSYHGAKPATCITKFGNACSAYSPAARPIDCLSPAQRRARAAAEKYKAKLRARARAREKAAEARAAAQEAAAAKAHAAAVAAANAWHKGYEQQDGNVFWRFNDAASCEAYAEQGCWHVEVITRNGCPGYVAVNANEYSGETIINSLLDNQGFGIPPKTPRVFELDADQGNVTIRDVQIDCQ